MRATLIILLSGCASSAEISTAERRLEPLLGNQYTMDCRHCPIAVSCGDREYANLCSAFAKE